jgi:DNA repair protein RecO (recombination protein O)
MGKTFKTEGIVLKHLNYGEADRILTIFTKHYGKIKVMAKGVRKVTSRKGGNVEAFNHLTIFCARGKKLDILTEATVINSFGDWRRNLGKVGLAYYFCELVDKLTPEAQPNQTVFDLLKGHLGKLAGPVNLALVRGLEEGLLDELGFGVPDSLKNAPGSLKDYLETVTEREIHSPKILRELR